MAPASLARPSAHATGVGSPSAVGSSGRSRGSSDVWSHTGASWSGVHTQTASNTSSGKTPTIRNFTPTAGCSTRKSRTHQSVQAYAYDALMLVARLHQDDAQRAHW